MEFNATFIVATVSFLVFIFIMNKILYKPMQNIVQQRQEYINGNFEVVTSNKKRAQALIDDKNEKITSAQKQSKEIIMLKAQDSKQKKQDTLAGAKEDAINQIEQHKNSLESEKNNAKSVLKSDVIDIAQKITSKLMGQEVALVNVDENAINNVLDNAKEVQDA